MLWWRECRRGWWAGQGNPAKVVRIKHVTKKQGSGLMSEFMTHDPSIMRSRRHPLATLGVLDMLAFAAPLLRFVHIPVVGNLYLTEVLLATTLFFQFLRHGRRPTDMLPRTFLLLLTAWLLAQLIADLLRGSAFNDYAPAWAIIGFALVNFPPCTFSSPTTRNASCCSLWGWPVARSSSASWRPVFTRWRSRGNSPTASEPTGSRFC